MEDSKRMASDIAEQAMAASQALNALRNEMSRCTRCDLYAHATQIVPGEGRAQAPIMLVGEQPGDQEDLSGRPFVGPAGQLLERALKVAGLQREDLYLTNAVKHFKWEPRATPRGTRRIHKTPAQAEILACNVWLQSEITQVRPQVVVCLGETAAGALLSPKLRRAFVRGEPTRMPSGYWLLKTFHPSYLLRVPPEDQPSLFEALVSHLRTTAECVARTAASSGS